MKAKDNVNILIDYFKVGFDFTVSFKEGFYVEFLKLISKDVKDAERIPYAAFGYNEGYNVGENIFFFSGGDFTRNKAGEETSLFELKGSACREFEAYGGSWLSLFELVFQYGGHCTRIDIAIDDQSGLITIDELKDKVMKHEYTTKTRNMILDENLPEEVMNQEFDEPQIRTSNNKGFTATFGGRSNSQLCIYNKKAEREAHGYIVTYSSWIRFECRYYHSTAQSAFLILFKVLKEDFINGAIDLYPKACLSFLAHLIEFKESIKNYGCTNRYLESIWSKWDLFCEKIEECVPHCSAKLEQTLFDNYSWFYRTNKRILNRLFGSDPSRFKSFISYCMKEGFREGKVTLNDIQVINNFRKKEGFEPISLTQLENYLASETVLEEDSSYFERFKDKYTYKEEN